MEERTRFRRGYDAALRQTIEETRKLVARSLELLRQPMPDTFLGRNIHEPVLEPDRD